eukprot:12924164-Prorocentrum_lima.AAC.1
MSPSSSEAILPQTRAPRVTVTGSRMLLRCRKRVRGQDPQGGRGALRGSQGGLCDLGTRDLSP